ncbi:hypothetical protein VDGL01_12653 [Verticillium dahliae]
MSLNLFFLHDTNEMSSRVEKPKSLSARKRQEQFDFIELRGYDVMPCSFCQRKGWKCRMVEGVSRCSECVRRGRSCDGSGVPVNALSRITQELGKLDKKELDEEARLEELQSQVAEALSRLKRLRTQKRSLHERGVRMVNQGLQSLDELDSAEREESEAVVAVQAAGGFGVIDWSALGSFDPESLDFLGTGDTASATVGSSGS